MTKHTSEDSDPSATALDGIETVSDLSSDKVYIGTVDRHTSNAIIELPGGHINLGPIDESAVGEDVRFKHVEGLWGRCIDEEFIYEAYSPKDGKSVSSQSSTSLGRKRSSQSSPDVKEKAYGRKPSTTNGTITEKDPDNKNKLLNGNL